MGEGHWRRSSMYLGDGLLSLWGHPGDPKLLLLRLIGQEERRIPADTPGLAKDPHSRSPVSNLLSGLRCPSCSPYSGLHLATLPPGTRLCTPAPAPETPRRPLHCGRWQARTSSPSLGFC